MPSNRRIACSFAIAAASLLVLTARAAPAPVPRNAASATLTTPLARVAWFVPNAGQFDAHVRMQARGPGAILWLTDDALWVTIAPRAGAGARGVNLKVTISGASPHATWLPLAPRATRVSYYTGAPEQWHSDLSTSQGARWQGVAPGATVERRLAGRPACNHVGRRRRRPGASALRSRGRDAAARGPRRQRGCRDCHRPGPSAAAALGQRRSASRRRQRQRLRRSPR